MIGYLVPIQPRFSYYSHLGSEPELSGNTGSILSLTIYLKGRVERKVKRERSCSSCFSPEVITTAEAEPGPNEEFATLSRSLACVCSSTPCAQAPAPSSTAVPGELAWDRMETEEHASNWHSHGTVGQRQQLNPL